MHALLDVECAVDVAIVFVVLCVVIEQQHNLG